ncbi:MAG: M48 family metallopeptidase [gamma proteobacterium symbiont of Bathyaustriella thionipta]|nr:M48 family metallopeptidase [gamma proteobacterium symbiont of Bathyaustriella thionipta]
MLKIPADIRTRVSRRARRMHLRLAPEHYIELVLPQGASLRQAGIFIQESSAWLQKTRQTLAQRQNRHQQACRQFTG